MQIVIKNATIFTTNLEDMVFGATLGTALFLIIGLMAFWLLTFLMGFAITFWVTLGAMQMFRPKRLTDQEAED